MEPTSTAYEVSVRGQVGVSGFSSFEQLGEVGSIERIGNIDLPANTFQIVSDARWQVYVLVHQLKDCIHENQSILRRIVQSPLSKSS